jgi:septum formation protein
MERILLASESPRRRELLQASGIPFDLIVPDLDESRRDTLPPFERVLALAEDKARAGAGLAPNPSPRLILAADTLVCVPDSSAPGGEIALGKPADHSEARSMIERLSGRTHVVRTGVALLDRDSGALRLARSDTTVRFAPLTETEIDDYISSREWEGAAGAYRIQGLGAFIVDRIDGSWTGVVGLPMRHLYVMLKDAGYRIPAFGMGPSSGTGN